ncbi:MULTISPECIES: helix-turn-helix domain-containing protein [Streptomyces]|uniref:helix-turn-helix domain-containing protein n=1 Tax=Streptomyces TaxID=1883 RepID=UPI00226EA144|nr:MULTISPECIES: helix-turn-helix transcriptional regulator [unclassified Streptomyces]MCY0940182.1 helix-turn-helix transcriptional regulator [Streptomyces sp. H34-AA3]MCZ4080829.1 helix-turn-helix transcriptional regulator [Streptomyces sp. H34-S5]
MAANVGKTFLRIVLGQELTRLRDQAGLTLAQAAKDAGCATSTVHNVESGTSGFRRVEQLAALLGAYKLNKADQAMLMAWHRQAKGDDWWTTSVAHLPSGMNLYLAMESGASAAEWWCHGVINGLFQTQEYAHELILSAKAANDTTDEFIEQAVDVRIKRQKRITEEGMKLTCIMDEAALTNMVGSSALMRRQLQGLIELTDLPNVIILIIPRRAPTYRAVGGDFGIFSFDPAQRLEPAVASATVDGTTRVSSKERQTKQFKRRFEVLTQGALPRYDTVKFLEQLSREV